MDKQLNHADKERSRYRCLALLFLFIVSSCASNPPIADRQSIQVTTSFVDGISIEGAKCDLKNDKGNWSVVTPSTVEVSQSDVPLQVRCNKLGHTSETMLIGKQEDGRVLGDLGGFGKLVLGGSKAPRSPFVSNYIEVKPYQYPTSIKVSMTQSGIDATHVTPALKRDPTISQKRTFDFDEAKKQCTEIGFREGTENFGMCVMRLIH